MRAPTPQDTPILPGGPSTLTLAGTPATAAPPPAPAKVPDAPPAPSSPLAASRAVPWEIFFFCWSPSEQRPQRRHPNLESAQLEAARLRRMYVKEFLVFEARLIPTTNTRE